MHEVAVSGLGTTAAAAVSKIRVFVLGQDRDITYFVYAFDCICTEHSLPETKKKITETGLNFGVFGLAAGNAPTGRDSLPAFGG